MKNNPINSIPRFDAILKALPFYAYVVGGAIRNYILNREINDIDLATMHPPDGVIDACKKSSGITAKLISERYGVVEVSSPDIEGGKPLEVTTFRSDLNPDGRHCQTAPVTTIDEDLKRRDFTVNAIAYTTENGLIDPHSGVADIHSRDLRFVGNPKLRLKEDLLRAIRALRFSGEYGLGLTNSTLEALEEIDFSKVCFKELSIERIMLELEKGLSGRRPASVIILFHHYGILPTILPELNGVMGWHAMWSRILSMVRRIQPEFKLEALLHRIDYALNIERDTNAIIETVYKIGQRLKLGKKKTESIRMACLYHSMPERIASIENMAKKDKYHRLFWLYCHNHMDLIKAMYDTKIVHSYQDEAEAFKEPKISWKPILRGEDLLAKGIKEGPEIGIRLQEAFDHQINRGVDDKEELLRIALK